MNRRLKIVAFAAAVVLLIAVAVPALIVIGMVSALRNDNLFYMAQWSKRALFPPTVHNPTTNPVAFNEFGQLTAYPTKIEMLKPTITPQTITAFVFGQSNATNNAGQKFFATSQRAYNYWDGKYYLAQDPLLGADGTSGSVWTLLANKLIDQKAADQVILIPAGVGRSSVNVWKKGGALYAMVDARLRSLQSDGLIVTHFLWHQGEIDNPVSGFSGLGLAEYQTGMEQLINLTKSYFPNSKFFVALVSRCGTFSPISQPLQAVQRHLTTIDGVYLGPNTDDIGLEDRYDDCHFSGSGTEKHASAWLTSIVMSKTSKVH